LSPSLSTTTGTSMSWRNGSANSWPHLVTVVTTQSRAPGPHIWYEVHRKLWPNARSSNLWHHCCSTDRLC
jgi:hypothetical protein